MEILCHSLIVFARYIIAKALAICLSLSLMQSCSGGGQGDEAALSVYSVGNLEENLVISGRKYTTRYGLNSKDPTFYVNKFGESIHVQKINGNLCAGFGVEFALSRSDGPESQCFGWKFRKSSNQNGMDIYQGYCTNNSEDCPADFHNKPILEYGLNDRGDLVFVRFDPQAPDSKNYVLRMGSPFLLN